MTRMLRRLLIKIFLLTIALTTALYVFTYYGGRQEALASWKLEAKSSLEVHNRLGDQSLEINVNRGNLNLRTPSIRTKTGPIDKLIERSQVIVSPEVTAKSSPYRLQIFTMPKLAFATATGNTTAAASHDVEMSSMKLSSSWTSLTHTPPVDVGRPILNESSTTGNSLDTAQSKKMLCLTFQGRLGNQLFQYASVLGLAYTLDRTAIFRNTYDLDRTLKLRPVDLTPPERWTTTCTNALTICEIGCCKFDERLTKLDPELNFVVSQYLQSWKYFIHHEERIKRALTFTDSIRAVASEIVGRLRGNNSGSTLVGVHIRRGDYTNFESRTRGFVTAPPEYLKRSFTYFTDRFPNSMFIVASDGLSWCKSQVPEGFRVIYLENNSPAVDMSILSLLDHVVITTGTFSWWAGYFNSGTVVYMKDFIIPDSEIGSQFLPDGSDYIYPGWIPL